MSASLWQSQQKAKLQGIFIHGKVHCRGRIPHLISCGFQLPPTCVSFLKTAKESVMQRTFEYGTTRVITTHTVLKKNILETFYLCPLSLEVSVGFSFFLNEIDIFPFVVVKVQLLRFKCNWFVNPYKIVRGDNCMQGHSQILSVKGLLSQLCMV